MSQDGSRPDEKSVEEERTSRWQKVRLPLWSNTSLKRTISSEHRQRNLKPYRKRIHATLAAVREAVVGVENDQSGSFFKKDGLLYRRRKQAAGGGGEDLDGEQLVLPKEFRKSVLNLAHSVPTAGHLGKKKTVDRILQRFYWPGVYRDVTSYGKSCAGCQKLSGAKVTRALLVPLYL